MVADRYFLDHKYVIGIDLGGTKTEVIALSQDGSELFRKRVATVKGSYPDTIKTISSLVNDVNTALGGKAAVGVAMPGTISPTTGLVKNANSYWLNDHDLKGDLMKALGIKSVFLENDANCFALSEATDGAGKDGSMVWGLILGTGSGSGIVHDKKIIRGRNLLSGEWGHNMLPWLSEEERKLWSDVSCFCKKSCCTETFISGTGLEREYAKRTNTFDPQALVYPTSSKEIIAKMREGDATAKASFETYTDRLARAIANYINFLDPDVVVLGGGMSEIVELYDPLSLRIKNYIFGGTYDTPIVKAVHGDSSGIRGAAWLPLMGLSA